MGAERPKGLEEGPGHSRVVFQRDSRTPTELSPESPNAPGCYWAVEPKGSVPSSMQSSGISWIVKKDPQGAMVVTLAFVTKADGGKPMLRYRPVAFDDQRTRYLLTPGPAGWSGSASIREAMLVMGEFRLDPAVLPFERAKSLGIEVVPTEARQASEAIASARALQEARATGIEVLPRPEVGKPLAFALTDTTNRVIRSADLKGKVVLIDCWAGWCSPCMAKMPRLKALYERRHADGFEVIGLNFDTDRARAETLVKTLGLPWSEVYVPADDRTRDLWADGAGISGLPRLFLIDRQGILRWDGGPHELEERITELLK
jgi:thiol-disulfide isomerase/thioredoxin